MTRWDRDQRRASEPVAWKTLSIWQLGILLRSVLGLGCIRRCLGPAIGVKDTDTLQVKGSSVEAVPVVPHGSIFFRMPCSFALDSPNVNDCPTA